MCQRNSLQLLCNCYSSTTNIDEGNSLITRPPSKDASFRTRQYGAWQSLTTTKFPFEFRMILDNPYASKTTFLIKLLYNYLFFVPKHHISRVLYTERTIIRRGRCYEWVSLINICCTWVAVWEQLKTIPLAYLFRHMLRSFVCKGDEKS